MTSRISFYKLLKEDIKKRVWMFLMFITLFVVIIPISTMIQYEGQLAYSSAKEIQIWFQHDIMGLGDVKMSPLIVMGAIISGITSFSHLHSKKQLDFYNSLPVRREKWFAVTYVSSLLQIMAPYVLGYILHMIMGAVNRIAVPEVFGSALLIISTNILFFLLIYAVTSIAIILTGKSITGLLGICVLMFYGPTVIALKEYIMLQAYETYMTTGVMYGFMGNIYGKRAMTASPITAYCVIADKYGQGDSITTSIIISVIAVFVASAAALILYKFRPAEGAGKAMAFKKSESVIKILAAVTAGLLFGVTVSSQNNTQGEMSTGWLFFISILAVIIVCAVIEFIYSMDVKMIFKKKISLGVALLLTVAICAVIRFDLTGYNSYLPKKEEIEAMSIDTYSLNDISPYGGYWWDGERYKDVLAKRKVQDFDGIYEAAQDGIGRVGKHDSGDENFVTIACYLKNGKTVYRSYWVEEETLFDCIEGLFQIKEYRREVLGLDQMEEETFHTYSFKDILGKTMVVPVPIDGMKNIMDAYIAEMETQPLSVFVDGNVIGQLICSAKGDGDTYFPIYAEFTDMIRVLEEYIEVPGELKPEDIISMEIKDFRGEENEMTYADAQTIKVTEAEQLQEVLDGLRMGDDFIKSTTERGLHVEITTQYDIETYYIRKGMLPDFL